MDANNGFSAHHRKIVAKFYCDQGLDSDDTIQTKKKDRHAGDSSVKSSNSHTVAPRINLRNATVGEIQKKNMESSSSAPTSPHFDSTTESRMNNRSVTSPQQLNPLRVSANFE